MLSGWWPPGLPDRTTATLSDRPRLVRRPTNDDVASMSSDAETAALRMDSCRALPAVFSKAESYRATNEPPMPASFTALVHVDSVIRLSVTRPPLAHLFDTWPTKRSLPSQDPWRYEGDPSGEHAR
jgi:hypothetical protein